MGYIQHAHKVTSERWTVKASRRVSGSAIENLGEGACERSVTAAKYMHSNAHCFCLTGHHREQTWSLASQALRCQASP